MGVIQTNMPLAVGDAFFLVALEHEGKYHHQLSSHNPMVVDVWELYRGASLTKSQSIHSFFHRSCSHTYQSYGYRHTSHFPILIMSTFQDHSEAVSQGRIGL